MTPQLRRWLASTACIVGFFLIWEALCWAFSVSDIVLPKPSEIIVTLIVRLPALWPHIVQTLYTTLIGFALRHRHRHRARRDDRLLAARL